MWQVVQAELVPSLQGLPMGGSRLGPVRPAYVVLQHPFAR